MTRRGPRRRALVRLASTVGVGVAALCWLLVTAGPAAAHAELERSTPSQGAHVDSAPKQVLLVFTEAVTPVDTGTQVLDAKGRVLAELTAHRDAADPARVRLPLPRLGDGAYTVTWRVVSADTHPVHGALVFSVGTAAAVAEPVTPEEPDGAALRIAAWVARWLGYAGLVLSVGGAVFAYVLWPAGSADRRARLLLRYGLASAAAGAVGVFLLQGPRAAGTSLASVVDPGLLAATFGGEYGKLLAVRLVLIALLAVVAGRLWRAREPGRVAAAVIAAAIALPLLFTYSVAGHTRTGGQVPLAVVADMIHLGAVCVWVGGLVFLSGCLLLPRRTLELPTVLPRFSRTAATCVVLLVATGTYQAWRGLGDWSAFTNTTYGRVLTVKLVVFCALLGVGAISRSVVQRRYVRPVAYGLDAAVAPSVARGNTNRGSRNKKRPDKGRGKKKRTSRQRNAGRAGRAPANEQPAEQVPENDSAPPRDPLRRAVAVETGIAATILAVTAVLVATPPGASASPRSPSPPRPAAVAGPYADELRLPDGSRVELQLAPARRGNNTLTIDVRKPDGSPRDLPELTARLRLPARDVGPLPVELTEHAPGGYHAELTIPMAGTWRLDLVARTTDIDAYNLSATIPVK